MTDKYIERMLVALAPMERVEARARFQQFMALFLEVDLERLYWLLGTKTDNQTLLGNDPVFKGEGHTCRAGQVCRHGCRHDLSH